MITEKYKKEYMNIYGKAITQEQISNLNTAMSKYGDNRWWELKDEFILGMYQWFEEILLITGGGGIPRASSEHWEELMGKRKADKNDPQAIKISYPCCYESCSHPNDGTVTEYLKYPLHQLLDVPENIHELRDNSKELKDRYIFNQKVFRSQFFVVAIDIQYGVLVLEKGLKTNPKETTEYLKDIYYYQTNKDKVPSPKNLLEHIEKVKDYWHKGILDNYFGEYLDDVEELVDRGVDGYWEKKLQ